LSKEKIKDNFDKLSFKKAIKKYESKYDSNEDITVAYEKYKKSKQREQNSLFDGIINIVQSNGALVFNKLLVVYFFLSIAAGLYFINTPNKPISSQSLIFKTENIISYDVDDVYEQTNTFMKELDNLKINYIIDKSTHSKDLKSTFIIDYEDKLNEFLFKYNFEPRLTEDNKVIIEII
jgi:hypothetical protein